MHNNKFYIHFEQSINVSLLLLQCQSIQNNNKKRKKDRTAHKMKETLWSETQLLLGIFCCPIVDKGEEEQDKKRREGGLSSHKPLWVPHGFSLRLSLGTTSSDHCMLREMLGGRTADSDMWKLSSNVDPLCFHILVFFTSILVFFHLLSIFFMQLHFVPFQPSYIPFNHLTCDLWTPILL